jgi:uncharacterized membrane protein
MKGEDTLTTETDSILTYEKDDTSSYHYKVTNSSFPDLTAETETFTYVEYTLTFNVSDDSSNAIKGATVSIKGKSNKTTDTKGEAVFELPNGNYSYTITAKGYEDATGSITLDGVDFIEKVALSEISTNISSAVQKQTQNY